MDMKNFLPGHLYECYEMDGKKHLARFERSACVECDHIWNINIDGEDCPKCMGGEMLMLGSFAEELTKTFKRG